MKVAGLVLAWAVVFTAGSAAAAPGPADYTCYLPNGLYSGSGCTGLIPAPGQKQKCNAMGTYSPSGAAYQIRCEASVTDTVVHGAETFAAYGPYAFVSLSIGAGAPSSSSESNSKIYFSATSATLPAGSQIPISLRAIAQGEANSSSYSYIYANVTLDGNLGGGTEIAAFEKFGGPPDDASISDSFDEPYAFTIALDEAHSVLFHARTTLSGEGETWVFVDPLPALDETADPDAYGLPDDWMDQVVLEYSAGVVVPMPGGEGGGDATGSGGSGAGAGGESAGTGGDDPSGSSGANGGAGATAAAPSGSSEEGSSCSAGTDRGGRDSRLALLATALLAAAATTRRRR